MTNAEVKHTELRRLARQMSVSERANARVFVLLAIIAHADQDTSEPLVRSLACLCDARADAEMQADRYAAEGFTNAAAWTRSEADACWPLS